MDALQIFGLQFLMSLVVWGLLGYWVFGPRLDKKPLNEALFLLLAPHAFRHIGMVFLVPGVVDQPLPETFAVPAAYGDLLAAVLALLAMIALRSNLSFAKVIVWVFSIAGSVDLLNALRQPEPVPNFGAAWYIPTFLVPLLLVTHVMIFIRLIRKKPNGE